MIANVVLAVLIVFSLASATLYSREGADGILHSAQAGVSGLFAPAKVAGGTISSFEDSVSGNAADATVSADTLSELRKQNEELRQTISELEEYRQEAQRLQGMINLRDTYSLEGVSARVLSRSTDAWNRVVTIDQGTDSGVSIGAAVMGDSGLIGQVIAATPATADVRLLADPQSGVSVMLQSNRSEGILRGSLSGLLYLEDMDENAQVVVGDIVLTSGVGGGYNKGIIVGTVVQVNLRNGDMREIVVSPNDATAATQEVFVVTAMNSEGAAAQKSDEASQDAAAGDAA